MEQDLKIAVVMVTVIFSVIIGFGIIAITN
ncbi:YnhF family membrane protein [Vibrio mexicanus]|nr:YnhF family membrane protein [Vibrio mexicanus]